MTDEKPVTKSDLIPILKAIKGLDARVGGIEKTVTGLDTRVQAMDAKLTNVEQNMVTKKVFDERIGGIEEKMGKMERSLKLRMGKVRVDLAGRIAKGTTATPTKDEYDELEERIGRLEKFHSN